MYLNAIGQFALLTPEQEIGLYELMQQGQEAFDQLQSLPADAPQDVIFALRRQVQRGVDAREDFINANYRLVVSVAKKYQATGVPLLDLVQEGNLGLMRAVDKFDGRKGFRFSTYGVWWIRQFITRYVTMHGRGTKLPTRMGDLLYKLSLLEQASERDGEVLTDEDIKQRLDITPNELENLRLAQLAASPVAYNRGISEDGDAELIDFVGDGRQAEQLDEVDMQIDFKRLLHVLRDVLDDRELKILIARNELVDGLDTGFADLAGELGLSRERIRQLYLLVLAKLRHPSVMNKLRDFEGLYD